MSLAWKIYNKKFFDIYIRISISYKISDHLNLKYTHISNSVLIFIIQRQILLLLGSEPGSSGTLSVKLKGYIMPYYDISDSTKFRSSLDYAVLPNFIYD